MLDTKGCRMRRLRVYGNTGWCQNPLLKKVDAQMRQLMAHFVSGESRPRLGANLWRRNLVAVGKARRSALAAALLCVGPAILGGATVPARAQEGYPSKPIRLVVPYPAGGASDLPIRVLAPELAAKLGQTIVVDNRAGANGRIGSEIVARSRADGYTLLAAVISAHAVAPALSSNVPFDPLKDFAATIKFVTSVQTLIARNSLPVSSVAELIAYAKKNPGKISFASAGIGSLGHLASELLKQAAGIDVVHVPYKGGAPAMADLMSGFVDILITASARPAVEAKKVKLLGVASLQRTSSAPDWPTIAESGVPGFEITSWIGIVVPAGTPRAIIQRLNELGNQVLAVPAVRKRLDELGFEPAGGTPEAFDATIRNDIARFKKLNIKLD